VVRANQRPQSSLTSDTGRSPPERNCRRAGDHHNSRRDTRAENNQGAILYRSYSLGNVIRMPRIDKSRDLSAPTKQNNKGL
jgi:hypothetical protein